MRAVPLNRLAYRTAQPRPACATASNRREKAMSQFEYQEFYERNLPHFLPPEATLFVTFRIDGSLPEATLEQWRIEKKRLEMTLLRWAAISPLGAIPDPEAMAEEKLKFHRSWFRKFEELLDGAATGPLWLKEDRVAAIVDEALRHRDGVVYRLDAYCVMPNHVHAVFAPFLTEALAQELANKAIRLIIPSHDFVLVRLGHYKGNAPGEESFKRCLALLM